MGLSLSLWLPLSQGLSLGGVPLERQSLVGHLAACTPRCAS